MPVLPLIADPASYRPCIQDLLADGPEVRDYWLTLFEEHVQTLAKLPIGGALLCDQQPWPAFRRDYLAGLAELRARPDLRGRLTVLELTVYREEMFAAHGIHDPFRDLKTRENELALRLAPALLREIDDAPPTQRGLLLVRGLFAGNLFDMGSRAVVSAFEEGLFDFAAARAGVRSRPWPIDDFDAWAHRLGEARPVYRQALFFVDNAGPDVVLGAVPLARELARAGTCVVLAANSKPALNDVTADELHQLLGRMRSLDSLIDALLRDDRIAVVPTGCESPLIDLSCLTPECCRAAAESDLLILEGMGRAVESNFDARFNVDTLKLALIKDKMVARILSVDLLDPVFRFEPLNSRPDGGQPI